MVTVKQTSRKERAKHVAQMNANFAIEDFVPSEEDRRLQAEYIEGTKTLAQLLEHAREFAKTASATKK